MWAEKLNTLRTGTKRDHVKRELCKWLFFMEKGMQDAKPRLNRLVESFLQQIGREIEGGSL